MHTGPSFAELNGVVAGRAEDRYRGPLERSEPPLQRWPLGKLALHAVGYVFGLAALVVVVVVL